MVISASSSTAKVITQKKPQVFINFRGKEVRKSFVSHLVKALELAGFNIFIDKKEKRSEKIEILYDRIDQSKVALAIFSEMYGDSDWCLNELGRIMRNVEQNNIRVLPIFFNVTPSDVKYQLREFGMNLVQGDRYDRYDLPEMVQWRKDLYSAGGIMGMCLSEYNTESEFVDDIVVKLHEVIQLSSENRGVERTTILSMNTSMVNSSGDSSSVTNNYVRASQPPYGIEQRLKELEEMLNFDSNFTKIVGIVGISGIGKTTLAEKLFEKYETRYIGKRMILSISEKPKPKEGESSWVKIKLLNGEEENDKAEIFKKRSIIVLDDVSEKEQIEFLLNNLKKIKKGSKIVITARDKSRIKEVVNDTYIVPGLDNIEALQLFSYYAFNDQDYVPSENFIKLSKKFVDYAGGNPRVLEELGKELCGKDEAHWTAELKELPRCCNEKIKKGFKISYDEMTILQKDAFLDIACFFRSENEDYVTSLLAREIKDLADKFMISVSAGQIEMSDLLCSLGKELGLLASIETNLGKSRLWDHNQIQRALVNKEETKSVRGIFLDLSKLENGIAIDREDLTLMSNLQYLKIFDSRCPRHCEVKYEVSLPEKLDLPLQEIRYLHWLKFPLKRLPLDFNAENLIDLRLQHSKIKCIWKVKKDTPNLKWLDLSHSTELIDLSALSKAESLQRLCLEGCTMLGELPEEMNNMKKLAFLNLKGCISLSSLPKTLNLISLKTLILSDCINFKKFQVISENLEHLYLDGTSIDELPLEIQKLQRLIVLNLKDCKMLDSLPVCIEKLKALEELILSGCSRLSSFPEIKQNMENLQILLLDRTLIKEVPMILLRGINFIDRGNVQRPLQMNGLSLLRRLCLSGNDMIISLESSISELYHLKWINVKSCKNLTSISTLPSNLECLDAHDCISLKTVASPLALLPTEQVPSSFIFTNCEKLEHLAKNEITCYGYNKGRLLSETLSRHNKGLAFEALVSTCFPGNEVTAWFGHKASGAMLEPELPRHWSESGFVGTALCAIVSFEEHSVQSNNLQVKCVCGFNNVNTSFSYFSCPIGGLTETSNEEHTIKSTHVFIGYTNWLNIKDCQEENGKKGCVPTKAFIKFEVIDDCGVIMNCKVLKCGFSLVYESGSWEETSSRIDDVEEGVIKSIEKCENVSKIMIPNGGATIMHDD